MKIIKSRDVGGEEIRKLLRKPAFDAIELSPRIREANQLLLGEDLNASQLVDRIVQDVRKEGDEALFRYTRLFDGVVLDAGSLLVTEEEYLAAEAAADPMIVAALHKAADNIRSYHEEQKASSWMTYRAQGAILGQVLVPLDRVGIYVPGGTAAYPSSVLMNAVPASVAGVPEILMMVPPKNGEINPYVLLAARIAGVSKIYKIGGAQAIAAMAFGTQLIPQVDKITGPGNIFVTLAKKAVYGHCDIDMLAGPSEILIVADASANPDYAAADMLSQAEHDVLASSILITPSEEVAEMTCAKVEEKLKQLPREAIARVSMENNSAIIVTETMEEAIEYANISAPEHMELLVKDPFSLLPHVRHAGAVFLGAYSPEPLGDYFAGPNHVLPTGGTAKFYSVLNVETFMKRMSVISYTETALRDAAPDIIRLAEAEGLQAHANAIRERVVQNADI